MNSLFRVRISTALLIVALLLLPFAALWVHPPYFPSQPEYLHNTFGWLYFDASLLLFVCSFVAALISAVVLGIRRQWRSVIQCFIEMVVCFVGLIFIPAY